MSFQKFLQEMFEGLFGNRIPLSPEALLKIEPSRFYVENVRSLFGVPFGIAHEFCDMAVKNGFINRRIGIECPNDQRIIKSYTDEAAIPEFICCDICEAEGREPFEFPTEKCKKIEFYELIDGGHKGRA